MTDNALAYSAIAEPTEYGILIRNIWYMLLYAWGEIPQSFSRQMADVEDSPSLDALLAAVLSKLLQQRLRIGLGCNYQAEERMLRGLRGRINFTKSLKRRAFEHSHTICEFENYSMNVSKNQIIRSTLYRMAQIGEFGPDKAMANNLRHTLRWLVRMLDGIDLINLTPEFIHRQQLKRHDRDYRIMLTICDFILQRSIPTEHSGQLFSTKLERDRLTLHRVYERFIANFYRHHLTNWEVRPQKVFSWHEKHANEYLPVMQPDIMLTDKNTGRIIILDTKFTASSLKMNQWGKKLFDSSHLYQMYAYLKTQEHITKLHQIASGILLYPAVNVELCEKIELASHDIRIECVDLAAPWMSIENKLLDVVMV